MENNADYKILNLYRTRQFDKCLKVCELVLQDKNDRMLEYIRMRAMTIQAKIAGNAYEEVCLYTQPDDLISTAVAKTPRPGTSIQKITKSSQNMQVC